MANSTPEPDEPTAYTTEQPVPRETQDDLDDTNDGDREGEQ